jgi:hypothetical protein
LDPPNIIYAKSDRMSKPTKKRHSVLEAKWTAFQAQVGAWFGKSRVQSTLGRIQRFPNRPYEGVLD